VLTELGGSQVKVQRCSLSLEGPRLRCSGAQCAQTLAVEVQQWPLRRRVGKAEVDMGVEAEVVEEKEEEKKKEEEKNNSDKI